MPINLIIFKLLLSFLCLKRQGRPFKSKSSDTTLQKTVKSFRLYYVYFRLFVEQKEEEEEEEALQI